MTREEFIERQVDSIMEDRKLVSHIIHTTVEDSINALSDKEFKEMLIEVGYEDEIND
tara:strand:- start:277 stop:447 length:171 start_codon:yes stop_codon:yes gene_type:complete